MVAYHEAGHTIIHLQTSLMPPLYKVSIVPRGQALGVTTLLPDEDQNLQSKKFLLEELLLLMGGRAAEKTFYDSTTNGAAGDLDIARKIARKMIHEWGMGEKMYYEPDQKDAELEINRLLENADRQAHELVLAHKEKTEKLAQERHQVDRRHQRGHHDDEQRRDAQKHPGARRVDFPQTLQPLGLHPSFDGDLSRLGGHDGERNQRDGK